MSRRGYGLADGPPLRTAKKASGIEQPVRQCGDIRRELMVAKSLEELLHSCSPLASRRGVLASLTSVILAAVARRSSSEDAAAKKKRKKKNRKRKRQNQPPLPPPSCIDGLKNGTETGVDCGGGTCPRCLNGQNCASRNDCESSFCLNQRCQACIGNDCGAGCFCSDTEICANSNFVNLGSGDRCSQCPSDAIECRVVSGVTYWVVRCGT
jgi:hypothetical protein